MYVTTAFSLTLMVPTSAIHSESAIVDMFAYEDHAHWAKFVVALGSVAALTVALLGSMFPMPRVIYAMSKDGLLPK